MEAGSAWEGTGFVFEADAKESLGCGADFVFLR